MVFSRIFQTAFLTAMITFLTACSGGSESDTPANITPTSGNNSGASPWVNANPKTPKTPKTPDGKTTVSDKDAKKTEDSYFKNLKDLQTNQTLQINNILASVFSQSDTRSMELYRANVADKTTNIENAFQSTDIESGCCGPQDPRLTACFKDQMVELNAAIKDIAKNDDIAGQTLDSVEFRILDNTARAISNDDQSKIFHEYFARAENRRNACNVIILQKSELAFGEFAQVNSKIQVKNTLTLTATLDGNQKLNAGCHTLKKKDIVTLLKNNFEKYFFENAP